MIEDLRAQPLRRGFDQARPNVASEEPTPGAAGERSSLPRRQTLVLVLAAVLAVLVAWRMVLGVVKPIPAEYSLDALLYGEGGAAPSDSTTFPIPDAAAIQRAQTAMALEPLNAEAYVVLALGADHAGRDEDAAKLMRIAISLSPRELLAQTWLMTHGLRRSEAVAAIGYFDSIARIRPDMLDDYTGALSVALRDPKIAEALADRLAQSPPWRTRFLVIAARLWRDPQGLIGVMDRLQGRLPELDVVELRAFLAKLWETGHYDQAYLTWLRSLPPGRLTSLAYLYNGSFQYPIADLPLDWERVPTAGVQVAISGESDPKSITVAYLGDKVDASPIVHDLVLAPGSYRLRGRVQADRLETARGIRWKMACVEAPDGAIGESDPFRNTITWRDFAFDFVVPETSCHAQVLGLDSGGRTSSERETRGTIAFSQLAVEPH